MHVIVTGASKGIGKAIALRFAAAGHHLIICSRNKERLEATASEIRTLYSSVQVHTMAADLSVQAGAEAFAAFCLDKGEVAILVNNAGIYLPGTCIAEPDGFLESMMNANLYSAYHLTRKLVPAMIKNKYGHIFNICSTASLRAYEGGGGYSISKYALHGFTINLRHELKSHGIKVTAVLPGAVMTDSWGDFDNSQGRIMEASDIAEMVFAASLLSPQAVVDQIVFTPQLGEL
jgi:short-subunit dehydrogenase